MIYFEILRVALASLRANPLRSILTMLGIIIGVAAVIVMVALGAGAQAAVEERISSLGTNLLEVERDWGRGWGGGARSRSAQRLEIDDARALRDELTSVTGVVPVYENEAQLEYENVNLGEVDIIGTWANWADVNNRELERGRFFNQNEAETRRRVAVLGSELVPELYPEGVDPVGTHVYIQGIRFEVLGVLEERGTGNDDEVAVIPLSTSQWRVFGTDRVETILLDVASEDLLTMAMAETEAVMRRRHRLRPGQENDFEIESRTEYLQVLQQSQQTFTYLLAGIAAVSLVVGGIGIMNIMLVSVTERTREIGIRRAIGARRGSIQLQFLIEAVVLSCFGGAIGIGVAWVAATVLADRFDWQMLVPADAAILSFAFAAAIGIVFGAYPAVRASRLDPIDALRYE